MTDSEKLNLLLEKIVGMEKDMVGLRTGLDYLKKDMADVKTDIADIRGDIKNLQKNDILILDEVERVHKILNKHIKNQSIHTA